MITKREKQTAHVIAKKVLKKEKQNTKNVVILDNSNKIIGRIDSGKYKKKDGEEYYKKPHFTKANLSFNISLAEFKKKKQLIETIAVIKNTYSLKKRTTVFLTFEAKDEEFVSAFLLKTFKTINI